ncbi:hypothetical protein [Geodermatophilus ruber]|uniref:Lipoprotein LprG n=1 Tax=Geodermatophilus ruber TaxID=504800 RepID=A0A1I4J535_9ACTN|nr:hypothetical protein [Geodermatophilus ruber]SFL61712.1 hypothetical protein SAMN04488085_11458 [Geodermatophilus ruber]
MPPRRRLLLPTLGLVLALLAGCSGTGQRQTGDPITEGEATVLADLLVRNREAGGANFVITAPYGEGTVLTLTGEVDFTGSAGRAQAVTRYGDERPEELRTLFFTADQVWFGDVPGLAEALGEAGLPEARYVRRPTATGDQLPLTDVLVRLVLNLAAEEADDPAAFRGSDYTWQGDRSIDGQLTSVFAAEAGWSVAVDRSDDVLVQYVTRLPELPFDVTVTLSDHGSREIALPGDEETVDGAEHPEIAASVGL